MDRPTKPKASPLLLHCQTPPFPYYGTDDMDQDSDRFHHIPGSTGIMFSAIPSRFA